jgi:hypothetical protein
MDRWLKLHLTKRFVNLAVRLLNKIIPAVEPTYPQTKILDNVFRKLFKAYKTEVYAGRFDDVPYQSMLKLRDRNFQRLLQLSQKLLVYMSETDRYYRQWLGLAMLLTQAEVEQQLQNLSFPDFLALAESQWDMSFKGAVPHEHFEAHKKEFQYIVLANFLMNLV